MKRILFLLCALIPFMQGNCLVSWSSVLTASTTGVDSSDPHVKVDANGNATAVWVQNGFVVVSTLPQGGSAWGPQTTLSGSGASSPRLVVDSNNNITAIWLESTGVVNTATSTSWSTITALSSSASSSPSITIDNDNNIIVIWVNGGVIQSKTLLSGGSWPSSIDTLSTIAGADAPSVAANDGVVSAVWHVLGSGSTPSVVYFVQKTISAGTWSSPEVAVSDTTVSSAYPHVAVNIFGDSIVIWWAYSLDNAFTNVILTSRLLPNASVWQSIMNISNSGIYNPAMLASNIVFDHLGNAFAVWSESIDGATFNVASSLLPVGQTWNPSQQLVSGNLHAFIGRVSESPMSEILAAYMSFDGTNVNISASETNSLSYETNFWEDSVQLSTMGTGTPPLYNDAPSLSVSMNDPATTTYTSCVWTYFDGSNAIVQSATGSDMLIGPATNFSVTQNTDSFDLFTENVNTLTWTASSTPNIQGYYVYRNGILLNIVSGTSYVDHNRPFQETDVYAIAAFDNFGNVSPFAEASYPP